MNFLTFLDFSFDFNIRHFLQSDHTFYPSSKLEPKELQFPLKTKFKSVTLAMAKQAGKHRKQGGTVQSRLSSLHFLQCMRPVNLDLEADL